MIAAGREPAFYLPLAMSIIGGALFAYALDLAFIQGGILVGVGFCLGRLK